MGNAPGGSHPAWATELWWESDPPDDRQGIPVGQHARWLEEALYVLSRDGARVVINLQVRDEEFDPQNAFVRDATGVYFNSGDSKPALRAWSFPFVTDRLAHSRIRAWGKAPAPGRLRIQVSRGGGWRTVSDFSVEAGEVFERSLPLGGREQLRARVAGINSLVWTQSP